MRGGFLELVVVARQLGAAGLTLPDELLLAREHHSQHLGADCLRAALADDLITETVLIELGPGFEPGFVVEFFVDRVHPTECPVLLQWSLVQLRGGAGTRAVLADGRQ